MTASICAIAGCLEFHGSYCRHKVFYRQNILSASNFGLGLPLPLRVSECVPQAEEVHLLEVQYVLQNSNVIK
jgi:hypothetical protein